MAEIKGGPAALVITAAVLWGVICLFTRSLNDEGLSPVQCTFVRALVTAPIVGAILAVADRRLFRIEPKDIWMFLGTGILSIVMFNICYFSAAEEVTMSMAAVLLYTAPVFVMLMSVILFGERLTNVKMIALALAFAGCVLTAGLIGGSQGVNVRGLLFGLGAGIGYAFYSIFAKFALRKYHPFTITFYTFLIAALALLPFAGLWEIADVASGSGKHLLEMLALGTVCTAAPYFLYTKGLEGMEAGKASVLAFAEPMTATVAGFVVYDETLGIVEILGILLILVSIFLLSRPSGDTQ
ncbi:putative permease [Thermoplasmatales archaeon BRNA1]|nr:putative permease [Thermoplasmatales archaeon BRNA1]